MHFTDKLSALLFSPANITALVQMNVIYHKVLLPFLFLVPNTPKNSWHQLQQCFRGDATAARARRGGVPLREQSRNRTGQEGWGWGLMLIGRADLLSAVREKKRECACMRDPKGLFC